MKNWLSSKLKNFQNLSTTSAHIWGRGRSDGAWIDQEKEQINTESMQYCIKEADDRNSEY